MCVCVYLLDEKGNYTMQTQTDTKDYIKTYLSTISAGENANVIKLDCKWYALVLVLCVWCGICVCVAVACFMAHPLQCNRLSSNANIAEANHFYAPLFATEPPAPTPNSYIAIPTTFNFIHRMALGIKGMEQENVNEQTRHKHTEREREREKKGSISMCKTPWQPFTLFIVSQKYIKNCLMFYLLE